MARAHGVEITTSTAVTAQRGTIPELVEVPVVTDRLRRQVPRKKNYAARQKVNSEASVNSEQAGKAGREGGLVDDQNIHLWKEKD